MVLVLPGKRFGRSAREGVAVDHVLERNTKSFGRSVMCLCEGAETRVNVDYELSEEFEVEVRMHQGSVLSIFGSFGRRHRIGQGGCVK